MTCSDLREGRKDGWNIAALPTHQAGRQVWPPSSIQLLLAEQIKFSRNLVWLSGSNRESLFEQTLILSIKGPDDAASCLLLKFDAVAARGISDSGFSPAAWFLALFF